MNAVLYTDGGNVTPRGPGGSGLCGYEYDPAVVGIPPQPDTDKEPIFGTSTAGFFRLKDLPFGETWVLPTRVISGTKSYAMAITNNIAELGAAIMAFEEIIASNWQSVTLRPDSNYVREGYTAHMDKWVRNGWVTSTGNDVANREIWEKLNELGKEITARGIGIRWMYVAGHSGEPGNERADALATEGKTNGIAGKSVRNVFYDDAKTSMMPAIVTEENPQDAQPISQFLLAMPRWYFINGDRTPQLTADNRAVYYLGVHGKDDELLGKPTYESGYSVVWLKEPNRALESIRVRQADIAPRVNHSIVIGHNDAIFQKATYDAISTRGASGIRPIPGTANLVSPTNQLMTRELVHARLAYDAVDELILAEAKLSAFVAGTITDTVTDITEQIFDSTEGKGGTVKRKIKKELGSGVRVLPVNVNLPIGSGRGVVHLNIGQDIMKRNQLAHLAKDDVTVSFVAWKMSDVSYGFGTIVESAGNIGIWVGSPANIRIAQE